MLLGMAGLLRDMRSAYGVAHARIGPWPGRIGSGRGRGRSLMAGRVAALGGDPEVAAHSVRVWDEVREQVSRRGWALEKESGREGLDGAVDLEMLGLLGEHVATCACGARCAGWLEWAVCLSESADVWAALGGRWRRFPPGHGRALVVAVAARRAAGEEVGPGERV